MLNDPFLAHKGRTTGTNKWDKPLRQRNRPTTYVGSLAKFRKRHTFSIEPFSSKSCLKNLAISMFTWNTVIKAWKTVTEQYTQSMFVYIKTFHKPGKRLNIQHERLQTLSEPSRCSSLSGIFTKITERVFFIQSDVCFISKSDFSFTCDTMNCVLLRP